MSYSIYYERAFIRVGDKFIPLANSGSNNCFEHYRGREVAEKNWSVLNWTHEGQLLFSELEIKEIARINDTYNQKSGMIFKSRNRRFAAGEFERWIINGMKSAHTVEEYVSFGNRFFILDYSSSEIKEWTKHYFKTTEELLSILDSLKAGKRLNIQLCNNREVYRPKTRRAPRKPLNVRGLPEYYILKGEVDGYSAYFIKLSRNGGFRYATSFISGQAKPFLTEKDALRYLDKNQHILKLYKFTPEKVVKSAYCFMIAPG
jgi:hypothetical protein